MPRSDSAATQSDDIAVTPFIAGKPKLAGDEGVWFFITADISMFAVLFTAFMFVRAQQPALFEQSRHALNPALGTLNTLILLASSWLVALAVHAARDGQPAVVSRYLLSSILVGAGFAVSKVCEYTAKIKAGITLLTNDFFMYYYVLTGLHFLHFIIGLTVLLVCWSKSRRDPIDRMLLAHGRSLMDFPVPDALSFAPAMTALLRHPMTKVWLMLTTATLVLFSLFENEHAVRVMTGMTIVIAGFKVRLVFLHFMELDSGARPWRAIAEVWLAAVTAMLLFTYLRTPL